MMDHAVTTPFGGGRMTAHAFLLQKATAERQEQLRTGDGGNETARADKWALLKALTEAQFAFGLSDRAIAVMEALVSFAPGRELNGAEPIIVFPSNRALSARTRGMAPATLRRHIAALLSAGLLFRRDSPNGKRYCRRDDSGSMEEVFGFDLAPMALKAGEIFEAADKERDAQREERSLRLEISLHQRDIAKIIACALEEERAGDWMAFQLQFATFAPRLRRNDSHAQLKQRLEDLVALHADVEKAYLSSLSEQELSASDSHSERHIQNSNTEKPSELYGNEKYEGRSAKTERSDSEDGMAPALSIERKSLPVSLDRLLRACPQMLDYAPQGIRNASDLMKAADVVRSTLGISPDAWRKAQNAMGPPAAAAVIAMMLERAETIRSPGGYLRNLTEKAENTSFSLLPMLQALERVEPERTRR